MVVEPSCPAFVLHDDDPFRRALIKVLDQTHFAVTFASNDDDAVKALQQRPGEFRVAMICVDMKSRKGIAALDLLRDHHELHRCGVIILGDPHPDLRTLAPWADETLLKPVDPTYLAGRARAYCNC